MSDPSPLLLHKNVKPTANRILVLRELQKAAKPVSLSDLEARLLSLDKSSIFRVLTLFLAHDVVHSFEDGRGILHYELCGCDGLCDHTDGHIHFYCETCHRSFCMDNLEVPTFSLPTGFAAHSTSFVIKGECPKCSKKIYRENR